jgi:hypothetical protein
MIGQPALHAIDPAAWLFSVLFLCETELHSTGQHHLGIGRTAIAQFLARCVFRSEKLVLSDALYAECEKVGALIAWSRVPSTVCSHCSECYNATVVHRPI